MVGIPRYACAYTFKNGLVHGDLKTYKIGLIFFIDNEKSWGFWKNTPGEYCREAIQTVRFRSDKWKLDKSCTKILLKKKDIHGKKLRF